MSVGLCVIAILAIIFMLSGYKMRNPAYSMISAVLWMMVLVIAGANYVWFIDAATTWVIDSLVFGALTMTSVIEAIEERKFNKEQNMYIHIERKNKIKTLQKSGDLDEDGELVDDE